MPLSYEPISPGGSFSRVVRGSSVADSSDLAPYLPENDHSLDIYSRVGQVLNQYLLDTNPDYHLAESLHHFSVNTFDSVQNNNGVLRRVNIYMGIQGFMHFDLENPTTSAQHVYFGSWWFNNQLLHGPSYSEMYVYYGDEGEQICFKHHDWPDLQADLAPNPYAPPVPSGIFTETDACQYNHACSETPTLRASITDPTKLALWSDPLGTIQLSFLPFHKRYVTPLLWGDGHNTAYFASTRQTNAFFYVEFIYSF